MKDKYIIEAIQQNKHWSRVFYDKAKKEGYNFAVRQHTPNYCDVEPSLHKLKNIEELEEIPFFKSWKNSELS